MPDLNKMTKDELIRIIEVHAKNWLAHDGCWFLAAEEKYGMDVAIALDARSWERFTVAEANRIMHSFGIKQGGGLDSLEKALGYRLYATVNEQRVERPSPDKLLFTMVKCRVQSARRRKGLDDFPCKSVGLVEYSGFASAIDQRIKTKCLHCPPDGLRQDLYCLWEFTI
jgi:hypothetical protein